MQPVNLQSPTISVRIPLVQPQYVPEPSAATTPDVAEVLSTFGASGTQIFQGFIVGEEYNQTLSGRYGLKVYDEMRRSDSTVKASLDIIGLPIIGAVYDVEPGSDDPQDILIAEQLKWMLFEHLQWRNFIRESLTHLPLGFAVFEKVMSYGKWRGNADGQGAGTYLLLDKLGFRKQATIQAWQMQNKQPGIQQISPNSPGTLNIPADKLLIFTHQREGSNFAGIPMLRSAYKNWFIKSNLEKIAVIAAERQGVGVPYFKPTATASESDKKAARQAMMNLRANEQSYLEIPAGWETGLLEMKAGQNFDVKPMIEYHDRQILVNVLGQFLTIGGTGMSGSYAASSDQSQLLDLARMAVANTILDEFNNNVVKQWVDLNFNVNKYPRVTVSKIANNNIATLADVVQKLKDAGALTPDIGLEEALRRQTGLPDMPEDVKEHYDELHAPVPAAAPAVDPGNTNNPDNLPTNKLDKKAEPVTAVEGVQEFHSFLSKQLAAMGDDHGER